MTNDTVRRYPRTLEEAFGPYTSRTFDAPQERLCIFRALASVFIRPLTRRFFS